MTSMREEQWPSDSIERLDFCPACSSRDHEIAYENLTDIFFRCAPGKWTLLRCKQCGSAFLNPRPTPGSIGRAYDVYYTHANADKTSLVSRFLGNGIFLKAFNGRLNLQYGLNRQPSSRLLGRALSRVPFVNHFFDPFGRSIPKPPFTNAKILDFGCGDGRFLQLAREAGWICKGIDFDPEAVKVGKSRGLDIELGAADLLPSLKGFDRITLSHVIEHVHDPKAVIKACFDSLNPGGFFWMETPNIRAYGESRFGEYWRGLECPRHLTIFTPESLKNLMEECGFIDVVNTPRLFVNLTTYSASSRAEQGSDSHPKSLLRLLRPSAVFDGIKTIFNRNRSEFIQIIGQKPTS